MIIHTRAYSCVHVCDGGCGTLVRDEVANTPEGWLVIRYSVAPRKSTGETEKETQFCPVCKYKVIIPGADFGSPSPSP